jgi:hypothetical protein
MPFTGEQLNGCPSFRVEEWCNKHEAEILQIANVFDSHDYWNGHPKPYYTDSVKVEEILQLIFAYERERTQP